jgi:hypothetical protein
VFVVKTLQDRRDRRICAAMLPDWNDLPRVFANAEVDEEKANITIEEIALKKKLFVWKEVT